MLGEVMSLTEITLRERMKAPAIYVLCTVPCRLAVPVRGSELKAYFGRSECGISNVFLRLPH